jgi:hypothetical protein
MNKKTQPVAQPPAKQQPVQGKTQPAGKQQTKGAEKK